MKGIVLFAIVIIFESGVCNAQAPKAKELGTVKVSIPSILYDWADPEEKRRR